LSDEYDILSNGVVSSVALNSGVADQPMSFDETIHGACTRAKSAFNGCLSVGIEGGLIPVNYGGKERLMNMTVAVLYEGENLFLGVAPLFELPSSVSSHVHNDTNLSEVMHLANLAHDSDLGAREGAVGFLTRNMPSKHSVWR
jgi:inosine/xanthosine triphosphatase